MKKLIALALALAPSTAAAQPASAPADKSAYTLFDPVPAEQLRDMDTDRPNKTNTPHTIDAGHVQIEAGILDYAYDRDRSAAADVRSDTFQLGQLDFRVGLLDNLELNLFYTAYGFSRTTDFRARTSSRVNSVGDLQIGGKLNLFGDDGADKTWQCGLAVQPQFKIPTARAGVGNERFEASVGFPFVVNLPADFHLGLETLLADQRNGRGSGYILGWQNAASLDRQFFGLDLYLEYWAQLTPGHYQPLQTIDVGALYALTPNIQLDAGVNFGLNRSSTTLEALFGITYRF